MRGCREYTEYQALCRLSFSHPNWVPQLPNPQASVSPLLFGSKGETHSLAGKGMGDPIPTKGQTLWYSMYNPSTGGCMGQQRLNKL